MSKFGRKIKEPPEGFEVVEPILTALENELREKVNEPHEGLRKNESQWPVFQINWQKSRYIYDMYYNYERISKEIYDYCITNKIVDAALIAKWKKPGYERLCSTYVINPRNYKFGTVSICRVPKQYLAAGIEIEDPTTGCRGCASGSSHNIFGNKYGQYLARIQVMREERQALQKRLSELKGGECEEDEDDEEDDDERKDESDHVVGAADGSSGKKNNEIWSKEEEEESELPDEFIGQLSEEAKREAKIAAGRQSSGGFNKLGSNDPVGNKMTQKLSEGDLPGKRVKKN